MLSHPFTVRVATEAHPAEREVVAVRDCPLALRSHQHRRLQELSDYRERLSSVRSDHASTRENEWVLCLGDQTDRAPDFHIRWNRGRVLLRLEQIDVSLVFERFGRDLDLYRPRPSCLQVAKGLVYGNWNLCRLQNSMRPLCDRPYGIELVVDLVEDSSVHSDEFALHLTGHNEHRRRCRVRSTNSRACVLKARTRHNHRRSDFAGRTCVPICHVRRRLLVASGNEPDSRLLGKAVQRVVKLHSRQPENNPDSLAV